MEPPLETRLQASKLITPPLQSLTALLHTLCLPPGIQDTIPLWVVRLSNFPMSPPLQHRHPPKHLNPPLHAHLIWVQDVSPQW